MYIQILTIEDIIHLGFELYNETKEYICNYGFVKSKPKLGHIMYFINIKTGDIVQYSELGVYTHQINANAIVYKGKIYTTNHNIRRYKKHNY